MVSRAQEDEKMCVRERARMYILQKPECKVTIVPTQQQPTTNNKQHTNNNVCFAGNCNATVKIDCIGISPKYIK